MEIGDDWVGWREGAKKLRGSERVRRHQRSFSGSNTEVKYSCGPRESASAAHLVRNMVFLLPLYLDYVSLTLEEKKEDYKRDLLF